MPPGLPAPLPRISVVVSTLDRPELLTRCLDALLDGTLLPAEVVVVDQGDPEPVSAVLQARRSQGVPLVHVVQDVRGLSVSQNAGVAAASSPAVAVVDDDCVAGRRWVETAARAHCAADGPLLVAGRVVPLPPVGERVVALSSRTSQVPASIPLDAPPWQIGTGGNFSVTRSAYLAVGGNDPRLGTGGPGRAGNDLDLFHRLLRAGVRARFEPDLLVQHERATPAEHRARRWTYGFGAGACVALWHAAGDPSAGGVLRAWIRLRLHRLLGARRPGPVLAEGRVLLGTAQGLWYGRRSAARTAAPRPLA